VDRTPPRTTREVLHLRAQDARIVPWKNGRGVTRELALWPQGTSLERLDFAWRLSAAPVDEPGPFSRLPGYERILVVTEGAGCELVHGADAPRARLRRLEPYRFAGAWATAAELPYGPVADVNVIFAPDRVRASVEPLALGARRLREALGPGHAFLHVLAGRLGARVTGEEEPFELAPGDSLWLRAARGGEELELVGHEHAAEALLVSLQDAS
jgi:uncharacterized protein